MEPNDKTARRTLCQIILQSEAFDREEALNRASELAAAHPGDAAVQTLSAALHLKFGAHHLATHYCGLALRADPNHVAAHRLLADQRRREGDLAGAIEIMQRALDIKPEDGLTRIGMAMLLREANRHEDALVLLRSTVEMSDRVELWQTPQMLLAETLDELGFHLEADGEWYALADKAKNEQYRERAMRRLRDGWSEGNRATGQSED